MDRLPAEAQIVLVYAGWLVQNNCCPLLLSQVSLYGRTSSADSPLSCHILRHAKLTLGIKMFPILMPGHSSHWPHPAPHTHCPLMFFSVDMSHTFHFKIWKMCEH